MQILSKRMLGLALGSLGFSLSAEAGAAAKLSLNKAGNSSGPFATLHTEVSYQLVSRHSGKCLDVKDHSLLEGASLQQWACNGGKNQKFIAKDADQGTYILSGEESQLCAMVADESLANGAPVVQGSSCPGNSRRIILQASSDGALRLRFAHSGKCLDVAGPSLKDGASIQQWECNGESQQDWYLLEQNALSGKEAWSIPGSQLSFDREDEGPIIRQSSYPSPSLGAIDPKTGLDLWSYASSSFPYMSSVCNSKSQIFLVNNQELTALDARDGRTLWSQATPDRSSGLACAEGDDSLFLMSGELEGKLSSLSKADGHKKWELTSSGSLAFVSKEGDHIYVAEYREGGNRLLAFHAQSGEALWERDLRPGEWYTYDTKGRLYLHVGHAFHRLDPANGNFAWTYQAEDGIYLSLEWSKNAFLFVRHGSQYKRLDPESGQTLWAYELPKQDGIVNASTTILRSGEVVISSHDANQQHMTLILLNEAGQTLWNQTHAMSFAYVSEDKNGQIFAKSNQQLFALHRNNGRIRWSYARPMLDSGEILFAFESFGSDTYISYGVPAGRYPPMGIVRLDSKTGAFQWDTWVDESVSFIDANSDVLFIAGPMGSHITGYRR